MRVASSFPVLVLLSLMLPGGSVRAQEAAESAPARTVEASMALAEGEWQDVEPGLSIIRTATETGLAMTAFRIDPAKFAFSVAIQQQPKGETAEAYGKREGAVVAVNGGFFGIQEKSEKLFPVGLLRREGRNYSKAWEKAGGLLLLGPEMPAVLPSGSKVPEGVADIIQSKPLLIEPGGRWAMNSNQEHQRPRTVICLTGDNDVILLSVSRGGMSVYEAGWLMRGEDVGGYFGCDAALALDGGGSTQLWVADHTEWSFRGETAVHNALIVRRRD